MSALPRYDDLPVVAGAPAGSSWGLWGEDDVLGCLNLLTPAKAIAGAGEVRTGQVFPLNLRMDFPDPPFGGRAAVQRTVMVLPEGYSNDEEFAGLNPQSSTQWDGFGHVQHPRYGYYNGLPLQAHGMHFWAERGIATRGVLVDMERWRRNQGRPLLGGVRDYIQPAELLAALDDQGTTVEPGDLLLINTGFLRWYRSLDLQQRTAIADDPPMAGLARGRAMAQMLWDLHPCAVVSDNMAVEAWPTERPLEDANDDPSAAVDIFLHCDLIPLLGMPMGELWDLERLADACAQDGVYSFFVTSAPMNQVGGISSMANAMAIR